MIDEELYKQATEELDSERRRPEVWARACALANDDHDEARYLYTNLRVEALLAEAESGVAAEPGPLPEEEEEAELEPSELDLLPAVGDGRVGAFVTDMDRRGLARPALRERLSPELDHDATLDLDALDAPRPLGNGVTAVDEADALFATGETAYDLAGTLPAATADRERSGDESSADDGGTPAARAEDPADDSLVETLETEEAGIDDTIALDRLDEAYRRERESLSERSPARGAGDADTLTRELRRQAEDLPGARTGAVIEHERDGSERTADAARVPAPASRSEAASDVVTPFAAAGEPLEIVDERFADTEYAVFLDAGGERAQAVRQGGSWGALVATLPWLLHRRLFGTALVYVLFAVAVLVGLAATALAWQQGGAATAPLTKIATAGFALLALAGLVVVPFRSANHWREDKLERRGFELVAYVSARDPDRAIELARDALRSSPPR